MNKKVLEKFLTSIKSLVGSGILENINKDHSCDTVPYTFFVKHLLISNLLSIFASNRLYLEAFLSVMKNSLGAKLVNVLLSW